MLNFAKAMKINQRSNNYVFCCSFVINCLTIGFIVTILYLLQHLKLQLKLCVTVNKISSHKSFYTQNNYFTSTTTSPTLCCWLAVVTFVSAVFTLTASQANHLCKFAGTTRTTCSHMNSFVKNLSQDHIMQVFIDI